MSNRPVICQIVHTLNVGGAELLARQFAEESAADFDSIFVCLDDEGLMADELRATGYRVEVLGRRPGFDVACLRKLRQILKRNRVGLIHAHQYAPFFYAAMARLGRWQAIPIVFTEHGRDYPDYRRPKRVLANHLLMRRCDRIIGVGQCVRRALIDFEGMPPDRIEVIYNGIDTLAYRPDPNTRLKTRDSLGLTDDEVAVIQVARLNHLKDHATALRAFAKVMPQFPRARFLIAGDGEERSAVEALVAEFGLGSRVSLLGTRRDVAALLNASDVFLLTSISEGIPLTLIEAMASGLPCVSTDVGGTGEVITDDSTGLLCPAREPEQVAAKLGRLLEDESLRQAMGEAGRLRAADHFDASQMHSAYQEVYRSLTTRRLGDGVRAVEWQAR